MYSTLASETSSIPLSDLEKHILQLSINGLTISESPYDENRLSFTFSSIKEMLGFLSLDNYIDTDQNMESNKNYPTVPPFYSTNNLRFKPGRPMVVWPKI